MTRIDTSLGISEMFLKRDGFPSSWECFSREVVSLVLYTCYILLFPFPEPYAVVCFNFQVSEREKVYVADHLKQRQLSLRDFVICNVLLVSCQYLVDRVPGSLLFLTKSLARPRLLFVRRKESELIFFSYSSRSSNSFSL